MVKLGEMLTKEAVPEKALHIMSTLKGKGFKCYLVGGCVRDLMIGKTPGEWDLTTDALPEEVSASFPKVVPTGIKYGTVTVIIDRQEFEVTTFRKDEKYLDGRHPDNVRYTKEIREDLSRRDFTINAMAFDPESGESIDLFKGSEDLENRLIRGVGSPLERFREDGLRPVRACRFASQLDFDIEEGTLKAIPKALDVIRKVAVERVNDELVKLLAAPKPSTALEYMRETGIMVMFLPELVALAGVEQPKEYHKHDVYWHTLYCCDAAPPGDLVVRLAALLHDIAKPKCKEGETFYNHDRVGAEMAGEALKRLKFSNDTVDSVKNLVSNHMFNYESGWTDSAVRRFMKRVGVKNIEGLFALRLADMKAMGRDVEAEYLDELSERIGKELEEQNALHVKDLKVSGSDVMKELNIPPGPGVGMILDGLLEKVIEDPSLNEKGKLLGMIRENA